MTPEEKAVIDAAYAWRYALISLDAVAEDIAAGRLVEAVDAWDIARQGAPEWYLRTYADVRTGDVIMHGPPGTSAPLATVLSCSQEQHHVKDGGTGKHWDDTAVEHGLTRVRLDYPGSDPNHILDIPSSAPVRVRLTAEEFRAIELLGWSNRT